MAYWGAPDADDDALAHAITAAEDMQRHLALLNARWKREGRPTWSVGIGIHAGDAFVGNVGSPRRLEYTLIGDTVNVASRLCSLAPGGEILVSEHVALALAPMGRQASSAPELRYARRDGGDCAAWRLHPPGGEDAPA